MADQNEIGVKITGDASGAVEAMKQAQDAVKGGVNGMSDALGSLTSVFGELKGLMAGIAAVLAGGAMFKDAVNESKKFTSEANQLSRALGISATEASTLNVALGDIYSSAESFTGAAQMLSRQLRSNEEGLNAMGLKTRDSQGHLRSMKELMMDSLDVLRGYKEGTDRSLASQVMFGRGGAEVMAMLKLNNEVLEQAKEKQEQLGLVVGVENVAAAKAYKAAMNDVDDVMTAVKKAIGDAVMPVLTKLGEWFSSIGPAAVWVVKGAIDTLVSAFWILKHTVVVLWETINAMVVSVAEPLRGIGEALYRTFTGDFEGAKAALAGIPKVISAAWGDANTEIDKSAKEIDKKMKELWNPPTDAKPKTPTGNDFVAPPDPTKATPEKSKMPLYEAELSELKLKYQKENDLREMSKWDVFAYWDTLAARAEKGTKDEVALRRKAAESEIAFLKEVNSKADALNRAAVDEREKVELSGIDAKQRAADSAFALGEINNLKLLQQKRKFEDERYRVELEAQERRIQLQKDSSDDPVAMQKLMDEKMAIVRRFNASKLELDRQLVMEESKGQRAVMQSIEDGTSKMLSTLVTDWRNFGTALNGVFKSILGTFVNELVARPLAEFAAGLVRQTALYRMFAAGKKAVDATEVGEHAAKEQAKTAITAASSGEQVAIEGAAGGAKVAISTATGQAQIAATAPVAAAEAAKSQAGIPVVGPALAFAAAGAMLAFVLGLGKGGGGSTTSTGPGINMGKGSVPSAAGGFDIPQGVNPLTQLHEQEMVLPKEQANVIRDMAAGGGAGGQPINVTIHAMDARSVRDYFKQNSHSLAPGLRQLARNFTPTR